MTACQGVVSSQILSAFLSIRSREPALVARRCLLPHSPCAGLHIHRRRRMLYPRPRPTGARTYVCKDRTPHHPSKAEQTPSHAAHLPTEQKLQLLNKHTNPESRLLVVCPRPPTHDSPPNPAPQSCRCASCMNVACLRSGLVPHGQHLRGASMRPPDLLLPGGNDPFPPYPPPPPPGWGLAAACPVSGGAVAGGRGDEVHGPQRAMMGRGALQIRGDAGPSICRCIYLARSWSGDVSGPSWGEVSHGERRRSRFYARKLIHQSFPPRRAAEICVYSIYLNVRSRSRKKQSVICGCHGLFDIETLSFRVTSRWFP
jgi:hypothetical protein